MLLVIDVGNTNTSLGVYDGERLVADWRLTTARARTVDEYGVHARNLFALAGVDFKAITAVAIASVVPPLNYTLKRMSEVDGIWNLWGSLSTSGARSSLGKANSMTVSSRENAT